MTTTKVGQDAFIEGIPCTTNEISTQGVVTPVTVSISDFASHIKLIQTTNTDTGEIKYQVRFDGYQSFTMQAADFTALATAIKNAVKA